MDVGMVCGGLVFVVDLDLGNKSNLVCLVCSCKHKDQFCNFPKLEGLKMQTSRRSHKDHSCHIVIP